MNPWAKLRPSGRIPALKQSPRFIHEAFDLSRARSVQTLTFGEQQGEQEQQLSFPIPRIADMDELHVVGALVRARALQGEQSPVSVAASSAWSHVIELPADDPRQGALEQIVLRGLDLSGAPAGGVQLGAFHWNGDGPVDGQLAGAKSLHMLVRLGSGQDFGPPAAAAPHFAMPGDSGLYGPALGGARLLGLRIVDGKLSAVLEFTAPLAARRVELRLVWLEESGQLPNSAKALKWSAEMLEARWITGPHDLEIVARVPGMPELGAAPVASFPGALKIDGRIEIDFSAAARSLLRTAYRESSDPTIELHLSSAAAGQLLIEQKTISAEYRKRLGSARGGGEGESKGEAVDLRGGLEWIELAIPEGLVPTKFTLTLDGRFGPSVLVASADTGALDGGQPNAGYRVAESNAVARFVPLGVSEAARVLTRVSVEGRGSGDCELLLALHGGDALRIGPRLGDPIALSVPSEPKPRWHRAALGPVAGAPPHPEGVWIVAQASRGTFWWTANFSDTDPDADQDPGVEPSLCRHSPDAGSTWDSRPGRPRAQLHQYLVEDSSQEPVPEPITCHWVHGALLDDVRPHGEDGPAFRGVGLTLLGQLGTPGAPIEQVPGLGPSLALAFDCRRDVDFRVLDAVMTYSPWPLPG